MGTTRIKVIDLSSDQKEIKTSRKHARLASSAKRAEKLAGAVKVGKKKEETKTELETPTVITSEEKESSPSVILGIRQKPETPESITAPEKDSGPFDNTQGKQARMTKNVVKKTPATIKKQHHRGKKYQEASKLIDKNQRYPPKEAIDLLYKTSTVKFDPTVELHLNVSDKNIKGTVNLPHAVGGKIKEQKYLVFNEKQETIHGKQIIWADESTIADITSGKLKPKRDFDTVVASPKYMPKLATVAKILGPVGMMPNPKNGTVTDDLTSFFKKETIDGYQYKTEEAAPIIHTKIGKLSAKPDALSDNLKALILTIGQTKIQKAVISSTMSPGIKVDIATVGK